MNSAQISKRHAIDDRGREFLNWLGELRERARKSPLADEDFAALASRVGELLRLMRAALSRYGGVFDAAPDAITLIDADGTLIDANPAASALFGYSRDELKKLTVFDLNPDLSPGSLRAVWDELAIARPHSVIATNRHRDGSELPVEVHSRAYLEDGTKLVVAIARDLRDRIRTQAELAASEERYGALLEAVDKGVLIHDARGRVRHLNAAAMRILDLQPAQILGQTRLSDWQLYDSGGRPIEWQQNPVAVCLRDRKSVLSTIIGLVHRSSGVSRWLQMSVVPQFHAGEESPFQLISLFGDVTELKRASELFEKVQMLARIGGWSFDVGQRSLYWTEALYRLLGRDPEVPLEADGLDSMLLDSDRERMKAAVARTLEQGTPIDIEARLKHASGRTIWVRILGNPLRRDGETYQLIGTVQETTTKKVEEDRLRRQAQTDSLTGLLNRDTIIAQLTAQLATDALRHPALLYIDLDRFKVVNDLIGHNGGDRLLVSAARRIATALPESTALARFGGDEFLALLTDTHNDDAVERIAESILHAFAATFQHAGEEFVITPSIGIARYPNDGLNAQALLNHADVAMYEAKRRGRNNWQLFSPALALQLKENLLIETQLRRAIENEELYLQYQPKIDLTTGNVVGAEALLRWRSRMLGELAPDTFIPIAETSGDIVRIGAFVLQAACRQLRDWWSMGLKVDHVAVNVSFRQFLAENFERSVRDALTQAQLPAHALELEMTERALIEDAPATERTLAALKSLGVAISIDDFGEGYSALGYLRRLPIAGIKISHHFMQGVPANATDARLCEVIIQMANALDLTVVAEGVETIEQRDFLLVHGAKVAQGYFFARPMAPADFERFARDRL